MVTRKDSNQARLKRHKRVRAKISGTPERPRLCVYRSANNISVQVIDDVAGITLVSASTLEKGFEGNGGNKEAARKSAKQSQREQWTRASMRLFSTVAVTFTTAVLKSLRTAHAKPD